MAQPPTNCKKCGNAFTSVHKVGHSEKTGRDYDFWTDTCDACFRSRGTPFAAPAKPAAAAPPSTGAADELDEIKKLQTELQECLRICTDLIRKRTI